MQEPRHYTCMLLEKIESGSLDALAVVEAFTCYCSEKDIHAMMTAHEMIGEPCQNCDEIEELNENGLCDNCQTEADTTRCEDCGDATEEEELDDNGGLCDSCMDEDTDSEDEEEEEKE